MFKALTRNFTDLYQSCWTLVRLVVSDDSFCVYCRQWCPVEGPVWSGETDCTWCRPRAYSERAFDVALPSESHNRTPCYGTGQAGTKKWSHIPQALPQKGITPSCGFFRKSITPSYCVCIRAFAWFKLFSERPIIHPLPYVWKLSHPSKVIPKIRVSLSLWIFLNRLPIFSFLKLAAGFRHFCQYFALYCSFYKSKLFEIKNVRYAKTK